MTSLAIALVLLFLIAIPGFITINAYYTYQSETLQFKPTSSKFTLAVIISMIAHLAWLKATDCLGHSVDYALLIEALSPRSAHNGLKEWINYDGLFGLGGYFITLYATCFGVAKGLQRLALKHKLDLKLPFLAVENPLVYRLKGRTEGFSEGDFDGLLVAATVDHDDGTYIYTGILLECPLDDNGDPKQLILYNAKRRRFDQDKSKDGEAPAERFYPIDGHFFVLEYEKVNSLNLQYIFLD